MKAQLRVAGEAIQLQSVELTEEMAARAFGQIETTGHKAAGPARVRQSWLAMVRRHWTQLAQSMVFDNHEMFADYVIWTRDALRGDRWPVHALRSQFELMSEVVPLALDPESSVLVRHWIASAARAAPTIPMPVAPLSAQEVEERRPQGLLAFQYTHALLRGDRYVANRLVHEAAARGMAVADIYLQVLQRSQYAVGCLWENGAINVAQEHYCSGATQSAMAQLYPLLHEFDQGPADRCVVVACVAGEQHGLGARMLGDFFQMAGWNGYFTGPDTPTDAIVQTLVNRQADVLALSASVSDRDVEVQQAIQAVRLHPALSGLKILVGGHRFRLQPQLWRELGADGTGSDAQEAVAAAMALTRECDCSHRNEDAQ